MIGAEPLDILRRLRQEGTIPEFALSSLKGRGYAKLLKWGYVRVYRDHDRGAVIAEMTDAGRAYLQDCFP